MFIRPAESGDFEAILSIYAYAREQMRHHGNPRQWGDDRPSPETVQKDIDKGQAYMMFHQGILCGVFAFILGEDPTYLRIEEGAWPNQEPYGTLHRIAGNGQGQGILSHALAFCGEKTDNIRIDTHEDNRIMRHLLEKYGFQRCGYIYVEDGTKRIAYQRCGPAAQKTQPMTIQKKLRQPPENGDASQLIL